MSVTEIWSKIPGFIRNLMIAIVIFAVAFAVGRFTGGKKVETIKVRDEVWTQQQVASAQREWERATHKVQVKVEKVLVPCPQPPAPADGCKPPCAQDCNACPKQTIETTTTTTTDTTAHGSGSSTTTTTTTDTVHETEHTTITTGGGLGLFGAKGLRLSLSATAGVQSFSKFTYGFGAGLNYGLLGPVGVGAAVYTDKSVIGSLTLNLGKWDASADIGVRWDALKPFYGGSVSRQLLGPVHLGAWGYSDKSFGLSASFTIP